MQIIYDLWWMWPITFIFSLFYILYKRKKSQEIKAQFVLTGIFLIIFYIVTFISGICTILNFLFRWII